MALIEINTDPNPKELIFFGAFFPVFFGVLGAVVYFLFENFLLAQVLWAGAGCVTLLFWMVPPLKKPLYLGWIYLAFPIGWSVSLLLMAVVYYGMFMPVGLFMRLLGRDALQRKLDPDAKSYWVPHVQQTDTSRYFQQF
jgi:hypothetical protein